MKIGWRKISAWVLLYALVVFATWRQVEIGENALQLIVWTTGFFFGANSLEHLAGKLDISIGPKKE